MRVELQTDKKIGIIQIVSQIAALKLASGCKQKRLVRHFTAFTAVNFRPISSKGIFTFLSSVEDI